MKTTLVSSGSTGTTRSQRQRRLRFLAQGYTVVEVAIAMTLFAIGATAIMAMERVSVQGDSDARKQDIATYIAQMWVERLRRDAALWTLPDPNNPTTDNRQNTHYHAGQLIDTSTSTAGLCPLAGADAGATPNPNWFLPVTKSPSIATVPDLTAANVDGYSYLFDMFGRDLPTTTTAGTEQFCAQVTECWQDTPPPGQPQKVLQATVRVIWPRRLNNARVSGTDWCAGTAAPTNTAALDSTVYHAVSETTLILKTPH